VALLALAMAHVKGRLVEGESELELEGAMARAQASVRDYDEP